jgi:hypothetical protein
MVLSGGPEWVQGGSVLVLVGTIVMKNAAKEDGGVNNRE